MRPFSCFIGDEYFGTGYCDHGMSHHYLCPKCGNIWARTICDGPTQHHALSIHCPEHEEPLRLPAVMFYSFRFYGVMWPGQALIRDFLYLMSTREQFITHNLPEIYVDDQHQAA